MTLDTLTQELKSIPTAEIKNGWTEKHSKGDETFGLNISSVQKVSKTLKKDAVLADEIYS